MAQNLRLNSESIGLSDHTINRLELVSVQALVAYAAYVQHVSEEIVRTAVTSHFGIDDVAGLPSQSFDSAIRYLVDFHADMVLG